MWKADHILYTKETDWQQSTANQGSVQNILRYQKEKGYKIVLNINCETAKL